MEEVDWICFWHNSSLQMLSPLVKGLSISDIPFKELREIERETYITMMKIGWWSIFFIISVWQGLVFLGRLIVDVEDVSLIFRKKKVLSFRRRDKSIRLKFFEFLSVLSLNYSKDFNSENIYIAHFYLHLRHRIYMLIFEVIFWCLKWINIFCNGSENRNVRASL